MKRKVWKVFVPHDLLIQSDAFLLGHVIADSQSVCICASTPEASIVSGGVRDLRHVGSWTSSSGESVSRKVPRRTLEAVCVQLWRNADAQIDCCISVDGVDVSCSCVIYDPVEFLQSHVLGQQSERVTAQTQGQTDNINALVTTLRRTRSSLVALDKGVASQVTVYCGDSHEKWKFIRSSLESILTVIVSINLPFQWLFYRSLRGSDAIRKIFSVPTVLCQLESRAADVQHAQFTDRLLPPHRLKLMNSCCRQVLDTVLGVWLMWYLMREGRAVDVAHAVLQQADVVATELKSLLHWLMGAPAGLKLNSQLTHFLGNFFQYHIYLWTGYLYLLQPVLGYLLYYCSVSGVWGLSVQLSLFQDILSTLTLHIYCFYVYAARLYRLQVSALGSLWRLFRGKKWNVLRQRVDSAVYDVDQLFLGTLFFTLLLFLLPTTALYYVVFALLRLLVLCVQGTLGKGRRFLNTVPVWSLCLWSIRSRALTDGAVFKVIPEDSSDKGRRCLLLSMQTTRLGFKEVLQLSQDREEKDGESEYSWAAFVKHLFSGDLIYPWIQRQTK